MELDTSEASGRAKCKARGLGSSTRAKRVWGVVVIVCVVCVIVWLGGWWMERMFTEDHRRRQTPPHSLRSFAVV